MAFPNIGGVDKSTFLLLKCVLLPSLTKKEKAYYRCCVSTCMHGVVYQKDGVNQNGALALLLWLVLTRFGLVTAGALGRISAALWKHGN